MSFVCPHCGRQDFKGSRGVEQHVRTSSSCKEAHYSAISQNQRRNEEEVVQAILAGVSRDRRMTRSQAASNLHHDVDSRQPVFARKTNNIKEFENEGNETHFGNNSDQDSSSSDQNTTENSDHTTGSDGEESHEEGEDSLDEDDTAAGQVASRRGLNEFLKHCAKNKFFAPLTEAEVRGIRLLDVLRRKKAPMNAYPSVMDWHLRDKGILREGQTLKEAGKENFVGRQTLIDRLAKRYNRERTKPITKVVRLPSSKEVVQIPVFDAEDCIVQLLTNPLVKDEDFDFFQDDPLAPPPENLDYVGNNITGSAFYDTYHEIIDGPNQQLVGCIYYIDGASTGHFVDLPVTAVKFSLTLFTRKARLKEHMWTILGYLPEVKIAEGRGKKIFSESGHLEAEDLELLAGEGEHIDVDGNLSDDSDQGLTEVKAQDFHFMLSVILEGFVELTETGMLWDLVYKNTVYPNLHLKFFIPMVRSDTEEADTLCGKYKTRTGNVKQICRQCHCPTLKADNHRANYRLKTQPDIEKLVVAGKMDKLKAISQHCIKNAWYKCRFNLGNNRGIHGACPSEMLHAMQLGIFKYTRDIFFTYIGKDAAIAQEINGLAKIYGRLLSHQSDRSLPATNFSKGIKEGKLMAKDYRGVLLIMAAVLVSTEGRRMLTTKKKFRQDAKKDDWLLLVELLLEWEAFLCQPVMKKNLVKRLDRKHRFIMYIMKKVAQRSEGMGLNIMKFHGIVHLADDILVHGVPLEFDTAANESHHKVSKYAAHLTQRNQSTFLVQVAIRMWEFLILDLALEEIQTGDRPSDYFEVDSDESMSEVSANSLDSPAKSTDSQPSEESCDMDGEILTDGARIRVYYNEEHQRNGFRMLSKSKYADQTSLNYDLLTFLVGLQDIVVPHLTTEFLSVFTRHQRGDVIFHAHPNFRGKGAWKDWAVIDWGPGYGQLPCHLHGFVLLEGMPVGALAMDYGGIRLKDGAFAVVEEAQVEENEVGNSDLFIPHLKTVQGINEQNEVTGRQFFLADCDAIVKPCAMIPDIGGPPNRYFLVKDRPEWSKEFVAWLTRPHQEDEMSDEEDEN